MSPDKFTIKFVQECNYSKRKLGGMEKHPTISKNYWYGIA